MKSLIKLVAAAAIICSAFALQAGQVNGYFRSNGTYVNSHYRSDFGSLGKALGSSSSSRDYVYRNPYAAYPSERVSGYTRKDWTTVLPYRRTPANDTLTDNLSYRGFGTVRVPRNSYGW